MYEKINAIVLHTIRYSDKNSIVHLFTKEHGRMSFLLPQGTGKAVRMRNAMFMPLSLLQLEAKVLPNRDIATMRDVRQTSVLHSIHANPIKSAIALFIAELMGKVIKGSEDSDLIYQFLEYSIMILDQMEEGEANFHICFLFKLGQFIGIQPDMSTYHQGYAFNMLEGTFIPESETYNTTNILHAKESAALAYISRMNFTNMHLFKFNRNQRNQILSLMLDYYRLHNSTLGQLRSPDILATLFS